MKLGKVVGTVVSTQKVDRLIGFKLLIIQELTVERKPTNSFVVAVDTVGAGEGEIVLTVSGSSARQCDKTKNTPVDATVIAIIDSVDINKDLVEEI